MKPRAGMENPVPHSPTTIASPSGPSSVAGVSASRPCSWRIWRGQVLEQARRPRRLGRGAAGVQGQDDQLVEVSLGALGGRVEESDRLDLVADELEPARGRVRRREDVHDAATHAPLPHLHHRVDALVAGALERLQEKLSVEAVANREPEGAGAEYRGRRQRNVQRGRRGDDGDRLAGEQAPADERALGVGLTLVAAAPEARLPLGELDGGGAEEPQILGPVTGLGEGGGHDERGAGMRVEQLDDGERPGRAGEAGDAQTDDPLGEGFRQLVKRRPLSQHRANASYRTTSSGLRCAPRRRDVAPAGWGPRDPCLRGVNRRYARKRTAVYRAGAWSSGPHPAGAHRADFAR